MHDCFGKPIKPFDRVRAATKDEFAMQGHTDMHNVACLSPAEQFAFPGFAGSDTCNCYVASTFQFSATQPTAGGPVEMKITVPTWPTLCTSRALVVI